MLNKIMVIGNLGSDPEMRYTPNGIPVTSFSLATSRKYNTQDGERREETEWFRVVAWNRLAEQCNQYLTKGRRVYAEGRLKSDTWVGNDGQTRFRNEISAFTVLFLDSAGERSGPRDSFEGGEPFSPGAPPPPPPAPDEDDLPW